MKNVVISLKSKISIWLVKISPSFEIFSCMFLFQFGANGIVMGTPVVYDSTGMCTKAKNVEWTVKNRTFPWYPYTKNLGYWNLNWWKETSVRILERVVMLKSRKSCACLSTLIHFLTGGFIYYRESNVANFWDRFNVLEHGSTDSLTTVFRAGAYLGKQFLITSTFIQFCGFINIFVK